MQEEIHTELNVPPDRIPERLSADIERGKHETAEVACLAFRKDEQTDDGWTNGFMFIRVGCPSGRKAMTHKYETTVLIREQIRADALAQWFDDGRGEFLEVAGFKIQLQHGSELCSIEHLCGANEFSELPGHLFRSSLSSPYRPGRRPLLHSSSPYFPSQEDAVRNWLGCKSFEKGEFRSGDLAIFIADNRARLSKLDYDSGELAVHVDRRDDYNEPLWIKAGHRRGESWTFHDAMVEGNVASLSVPAEIDQLDVYLMGAGTEIVDRHVEYSRASIGLPGVVISSRNSRGAEPIRSLVARGEGETAEFKVFVDPKNNKALEVVNTVIAFANTRGGTILIGVSDACELTGIDRGLEAATKARNEPTERDQEKYVTAWRQKISHGVSPDPSAQVSLEKLDGRTLLVIEVPAGKDRPYMDPRTRKSFVRRGANTVAPDPRSDWSELLDKDPFRPGRSGGLH